MTTFFCNVCNKQLLLRNKERHEKSKKHVLKSLKNFKTDNLIPLPYGKEIDCTLCTEKSLKNNFCICPTCRQLWCSNCDTKLYKCPYCRTMIPNREQLMKKEREERIVEQLAEQYWRIRQESLQEFIENEELFRDRFLY